MQQYKVTVKLGDSNDHIVSGKIVTIPEIAILRRVHGDNAVQVTAKHAEPAMFVDGDFTRPRSEAEERERLRLIYDAATPDAEPLVDRLFGGSLTPLPTKLSQIGIDPRAQAEALHRQAEAMAQAASALNDEPENDVDAMFDDDDVEAAA